ncbi:MAG: replication-associated recombination protein A [Myxococcales bacterium]|nr:replication-associated recombination protein A [Myxococcales bacterium]
MDLFTHRARKDPTGRPLAERMRPRDLDEFVGQAHLLGPGKLLAASPDGTVALPSLILWGPPGTGKTTLARILATRAGAFFAQLSAVSAGVKDLREAIALAERERGEIGRRTVLFLDEIHRFNKAQQDALLPSVEAGVVTLIGATTENPSFEVNAALLSRCRVVRLDPIDEPDLRILIDRALADRTRGLGAIPIDCPDEVRAELSRAARGDGRRALNTLEVAVQIARPGEDGRKRVDLPVLEEALQHKTLLYDEDEHYHVVSAFIKSMRGSDPDAAVYWMARMLDAGEDPLFVLRRMVIFAAEDIGVADPRALQLAMAATEAFRFVGMPEGWLPMTEAAIYLATAPKSNSALTTSSAARAAVAEHGALPVPKHLRNAPTPLMKEMGHGAGYLYPHDFAGAAVAQEFLPEKLVGRRFYEPREAGHEKTIIERLRWLAERRKGPLP